MEQPPSSVTVTGSLKALVLPDACASCGRPGGQRLRIEKVFRRSGGPDDPWRYVVAGVDVPFCPSCVERHRAGAVTISPLRHALLCFRAPVIIAALSSGAIALWLAPAALAHVMPERGWGGLIFMGIVLAFGLIALLSARAAWEETRRYAVIPATSVTSAFDYTDDESELFDRQRRTYTLRNPAFAEAFATCNQQRRWDADSPGAKAAASARTVVLVLVVGGGLAWLAWEIASGLLR